MADVILPKRSPTGLSQDHQHPSATRLQTRQTGKVFHTYFSRENIKSNILFLYGENILRKTKCYEKLRSKRNTLLCDLTFLLRCRDNNVVPNFLKLSFNKQNRRTNNILRKASLALLRESIKDIRKNLDITNTHLIQLHLLLANTIDPIIWNQLEQLTFFRSVTDANLKSNKQDNKLHRLIAEQTSQIRSHNKIDPYTVVRNESDLILDAPTVSVLAKGFNFAVTPRHIPTEEIICGVESSLSHIEEDSADMIRHDVARILRKAKPPSRNISKEEERALITLSRNKEVIVLPADKGNVTVIMNSAEYDNKMTELLSDQESYRPISTDPTTYLEKLTKTKIIESNINEEIKKNLIPREKSSRCPKIYGLPKIHKQDIPLRPIVSSIGSPLQNLAAYLSKELKPYAEDIKSYVKNANHFIEIIKNESIQPEDLIVSFDVISLFPNIPIKEALDIIVNQKNPPEHIMNLVEHCLNNTYFIYNGQRYRQTQGAPMGSPLSPIIANLFMEHIETKALETAELKPKLWLRYVDDTFVIWPHGRDHLDSFLSHLNGIHPKIKFTMETENNNQLPFLDVLVKKKENGKLSYTVYRKKTHTDRYLNAKSHHHPSQLKSVINTLVTRSKRLADTEHTIEETNHITQALLNNGYNYRDINKSLQRDQTQQPENNIENVKKAFLPYIHGTTDKIARILNRHEIKTIFHANNKIETILRNPKQTIPLENQGVYEIPCKNCNSTYIGQTNRRIAVRRDEHINAVKNRLQTSSLVQHIQSTKHEIDFNNTKTIARPKNLKERLIRESIEIQKRTEVLNIRNEMDRLHHCWHIPLQCASRGQVRDRPTMVSTVDTIVVAAGRDVGDVSENGCDVRAVAGAEGRQEPDALKVSSTQAGEGDKRVDCTAALTNV